MAEARKTFCINCHCKCGLVVHLENGRVVKVEPDHEHPITRGFMCIKGRAIQEIHDHPDRLNYPLKRVGERGENRWQRISWDQALDEIAERLKDLIGRYGPETVAIAEGTERTKIWWIRAAFANSLGTPNLLSDGTICFCNCQLLHIVTCGEGYHYPTPISPESRCLVLWGINPINSAPPLWRAVREAKQRGVKLIVVDPRFTEAARLADIWLPLRPATDGAMALGWINHIISEGLYDKEFVEKWCHGFDQLAERAKEYPLERVAEITRVPADRIAEAARMYATNRPAMIPWGLSPDQIGRNSSQAIRAIIILKAITGNLDVPGGEPIGYPEALKDYRWDADVDLCEALSFEQGMKQLGCDRYRLMSYPGWRLISESRRRVHGRPLCTMIYRLAHPPTAWEAMITGRPYPVKALLITANNSLLSRGNTRKVYQALKSLDLLVVTDYWMTPTAMLADYVLPGATWLERPFCTVGYYDAGCNYVLGCERATRPLYERREDYELWRGLALRLGLKGFPWEKTIEEVFDWRLSSIGLTLKEVAARGGVVFFEPSHRKYEKHGFATPTGKVELYSTILEKLGYDPLPHYEEPIESPIRTPELHREYPLILCTSPRHLEAYHSEHRYVRMLRSRHPDPQVEIHEQTAAELGIAQGDWVYVETRRGRIRMRAKLTTNIPEDVVMTEHSWWFPEEPAEEPFLYGVWVSNANVLTCDDPAACDPICGGWTNRGLLCKVYKVPDYRTMPE